MLSQIPGKTSGAVQSTYVNLTAHLEGNGVEEYGGFELFLCQSFTENYRHLLYNLIVISSKTLTF